MRKVSALFVCGLLSAVITLSAVTTDVRAHAAEQPSVMRAVAPVFPIPDKGPYAAGSVIVEARVNPNGDVIAAHAVQGHPFLYRASEAAARRWLFAPSSDKSQERAVRLTFIFKMIDADAAEEELSPIFMPPYQIEVRRNVPFVKLERP